MVEQEELYDDSKSEAYTAYERSNMTVHVELPLLHYLVETQRIVAGSTVLDYGCGSGSFARVWADTYHCTVVGVDASPAQIALAKKKRQQSKKIAYHVIPARGPVRVGVGSFDTVWMAWVLVMIATKDHAVELMRNAHDHLQSGGRLVILTFLIGETDAERFSWQFYCAQEGLQFDLLSTNDADPFETRFTYQEFTVPNYYLSRGAYQELLVERVGFERMEIVPASAAASTSWKNYAAACNCVAVVAYKK